MDADDGGELDDRTSGADRPFGDSASTVDEHPLLDDDGLVALRRRLVDLDGWRVIGRGGFATVFAARQERLGRQVAVKLLRERPSPNVVRWFLRECEVMGGLSSHPHIVTIHDSGVTDDGRPYLVMEHLAGGSLADRIADGAPLPWQEVLSIGTNVTDALAAAHERGILHLDIKPANVMVSQYGAPKLGDFGIARLETSGATTSVVPFSPFYVAPEVVDGQRPTRATDVYALGATLATLLRGRPPYWRDGDNAVSSVLTRTMRETVISFDDVDLPEPLQALLSKMLARDPARRPSVDAVREALVAIEDEGSSSRSVPTAASTSPARRHAPAIIALVMAAAAIVVAAVSFATRHAPARSSPALVASTTVAASRAPAAGAQGADVATTSPAAPSSTATTALQTATSPAVSSATTVPANTPAITSGDDRFPAIPGGRWFMPPDAVVAVVKAGTAGREPNDYVKFTDVRQLELNSHTFLVFRSELQDATLDPATFRQQFVKGVLLGSYVENPTGSTVIFKPQGNDAKLVFAGNDHGGWVVSGDTNEDTFTAASAIIAVIGGAPI